MSTVTTYQAGSQGSRPMKTPTPPLVKLEKNYWRYVTKRWVSFLWRASLWPVPVTFVIATLFLDRNSIVSATLLSCPFFVFVYPILATRRSYITNPPRTSPSSSTFSLISSNLKDRRQLQLVGAYVLASVAYASFYCLFARPEANLGLFNPTQRHPWHLNERFVFLILGSALMGVWTACSELSFDKLKPEWPAKRIAFGLAVWASISQQLESIYSDSALMGFMYTQAGIFAFIVTYYLLHKWFWSQLLWLSFGSLRGLIINFARSNRSNMSISVVGYLANIQFLFYLVVKIPSAVMIPYIVQPVDFNMLTRKSGQSPERALLLALSSRDQYYLQFTLMELLRVVHNKERRKAIFSEVTTNSQTDLTTAIWQELLIHLGRANQNLSTRGGTRVAARPAPSSIPASRPSDARAIPLQSGAIFRPAVKQQSGLQTFFTGVMDGPIQATPQAVKKIQQIESKGEEKAQAAAQGALEWVERKPISGPVLKQSTSWLDENVWSVAGKEWARRSIALSLGDMILAQRVIEVFAVLCVASLEEDIYGHVQHVLPATLEAIIRFRSGIVSLESELLAQAGSTGKPGQAAASQVKQTLSSYLKVCDDGINKIVDGYGTSMSAFRFPPSIASALNEICKDDP